MVDEHVIAGGRAVPGQLENPDIRAVDEFEPGTEFQLGELSDQCLGAVGQADRPRGAGQFGIVAEHLAELAFRQRAIDARSDLGLLRLHRVLAGHQVLEKATDAVFVVAAQQFQALAQVFQHGDAQLLQARPTLAVLGRPAPGQLFGHFHRALPFAAALAMAEQHEDQHIGPGEFEEMLDDPRQLTVHQDPGDRVHGLLAGAKQLVAALGGLNGALLAQFHLVPQGADVFVELVQQAVEQQQVAAEAVDDTLHHPVHFRQQAALLAFAGIEDTGLGHAVEQAAGRVVVLGEQRLVLQGDLQVGRVQVGEGGLVDVGEVVVVEDEVEEHAHQVDHVGFVIGQLLLAGQAAVAFQLLLQVRLQAFDPLRLAQLAGEVLGGLLLQSIQGFKQFGRAVGTGGAARGKTGNAWRTARQGGITVVLAAFAEQGGQAAEQLPGVAGRRTGKVRRRDRGSTSPRLCLLGGAGLSRRVGLWVGHAGGALHAVFQVGQDSGLDQPLVERFVDIVQAMHHMLVEEHVEDGLDPQRERAGLQRFAEGQCHRLRAEGVVVVAQLASAVEHRQALVEGEQRLGAAGLDPADHVGDQQALLVLLVFHQLEVVGVQLAGREFRLQLAAEEILEALGDVLVIGAFYLWALLADVPHAVEEEGLYLVVLGLLGAFEEGVVDLAEHPGEMLRQAVHHQLPAALHQFAEARLYAAAGQGRHGAGRGWGSILIAHSRPVGRQVATTTCNDLATAQV
ncbi:hypothetical protein D9M68_506210 [compost metagenome]